MTNTDIQIADYPACTGPGRLTVTEDVSGIAYTFRVTTRSRQFMISDDQAVALAKSILERQGHK